jgi:FAD/FMN-containing dehydrogenase
MTNRRELLKLFSIGSAALPLTKFIQAEPLERAAAAHDLRAEMQGKVVLPGEEAYASVRQIWNGAVTYRPAMFALCEHVRDVQAAVRVARALNLPPSVRGGGHDWAGRALRDGGLVIDLTRMRHVQVDLVVEVATLAVGATTRDVGAATTPYGLACVAANVSAVGMAGFLLAGGYGGLTTRFGMAVDNLLGAELVLADGQVVWADESQNKDLFWAIRGGGGNFRLVTSMRIRLHPVDKLLAGLILFPWSQAQTVLRGHAEIMSAAPDELSARAGEIDGPDGSPVLVVAPVWTGALADGEKYIARFQNLGTPIVTKVAPMSFADLVGLSDAQIGYGRYYEPRTRWLADLSAEAISAVVAAGTRRTSPYSFIVIHHLHGPATRVAPDATAFYLRRNHFIMEIGAAWEANSNAEAARHRQWASDLSEALAPVALPGGYANFLTPDDHGQVESAYGNNARRLRDLKRNFDPDNVFSSAIPLA